jgi:anti-anti-sigma factor
MEFMRERDGAVMVVRLIGRLDARAVDLAEETLLVALSAENPLVALDMSEMTYISSAGLRVLLKLAKQVQQGQGRMALFGLMPNVRHVFAVSGFDTILALHPDRAAAVASLR